MDSSRNRCRMGPSKSPNKCNPTQSFVLNPNFKTEPEPEYHVVSDEEVDELLPFQYKPDPAKQIDWDAVLAQPHVANVENSAAYKAVVVNLKKRGGLGSSPRSH